MKLLTRLTCIGSFLMCLIRPCLINGFSNVSALNRFSLTERRSLQEIIKSYLSFSDDIIWSPVSKINNQNPYIFFHQRKSGGTSLREDLHKTAVKLKLSSQIACYSCSCEIYGIKKDKSFAIYAMHITWGSQKTLGRFKHGHRKKFSCSTNFRNPLNRILSCIYFRFWSLFVRLQKKCVTELTPNELINMLVTKTDKYGTSCLNEPFRVLSGMLDEDVIDTMGYSVEYENSKVIPNLQIIDTQLFNLSLVHLYKCVPIILEYPESWVLLKRKFPILYSNGAFNPSTKSQEALKKENIGVNCTIPTDDLLNILFNITSLERVLYDTVYRKVKISMDTLKREKHF